MTDKVWSSSRSPQRAHLLPKIGLLYTHHVRSATQFDALKRAKPSFCLNNRRHQNNGIALPSGIAATFEAAREAFEAAWSELRLTIPDTAFAEWRQDRDWWAEVAAKRARGEKLDSEIRSTLMRCVCGTTFNSWKPAESYPHRVHITAAQAAIGYWPK